MGGPVIEEVKPTEAKSLWPKFMLREHIVAGPNYNRWLFPPAALLVHLSIGQIYAFSVFNKPLTKLCHYPGATCEDWDLVQVGWVLQATFVVVGCSTFLFGKQLEILGPRVAGFLAAVCWGGGWCLSSIAVHFHNLPLLFLGNGVIAGIGIGCGYLSPVSTLMKWFPDRPGMATGLAVMGFGGGALIGAPLGVLLMHKYTLAHCFVILGAVDLLAMLVGAFAYRVPAPGWTPAGWTTNPTPATTAMLSMGYVDPNRAITTPQFWLVWVALCTNTSSGLAILGQASLIVQDMAQVNAVVAGGIVGVFSLFNIFGRIFWSSVSDLLPSGYGRFLVYCAFFCLGISLYQTIPVVSAKSEAAIIVCLGTILSTYGGGFAAVPAYIRDLFGVEFAGAIHGRMLTAWSVAALLGPYLLNSIREHCERDDYPLHDAYRQTFDVLCCLLSVGLVANLLVPVANRCWPIKRIHHLTPDASDPELGGETKVAGEYDMGPSKSDVTWTSPPTSTKQVVAAVLFWCVPLVGLGWGLYMCALKARAAF